MSHTPGPWEISYAPWPCPTDGAGEPNPPAAFVGPADALNAVTLVFGDPYGEDDEAEPSATQRANAALIAAAPDMLEMLRDISHWYYGTARSKVFPEQAFRAVIAKAEGAA